MAKISSPIFGMMDVADTDPLVAGRGRSKKLGPDHQPPADSPYQMNVKKSIKRRVIPANNLNVKPPAAKENLADKYTNVVDIPPELVNEFKALVEKKSEEYNDLLIKGMLPDLMALNAAITYTVAFLTDGSGTPPSKVDTDVVTMFEWFKKLELLTKLVDDSDVDAEMKDRFLRRMVMVIGEKIAERIGKPFNQVPSEQFDGTVGIVRHRGK